MDKKVEKEITGADEIKCDVAVMKAFRKAGEAMSPRMLKSHIQSLRYSIHRLEMEMKVYQDVYDKKMDDATQNRAGDPKGGEVNA
jgi:hypothetical protein